MVSASNFLKYLSVFFSSNVLIFFIDLIVLFLRSCVVSCFSLFAWRIFICQIPSLFHVYILTACIKVFNSFSFFAKSLMPPMQIRLSIFSCNLLSLYPPIHFLSVWLSGIIAITSSDSASPWNMRLWIFASAKLHPSAGNSTLQVSMVFSMKFMTSSDIFLREFIIQLFGTISYTFSSSIHTIVRFFRLALVEDELNNVQ